MKSYTKVYLKYFGYGPEDFIPCEICSQRAVDIHHIRARSTAMDLLNNIKNLMALCRKCHEKYGDKKEAESFLQNIHNKRINK